MDGNEYRFVTDWRVESTVDKVYEILSDPVGFMFWWPSVYLDVRQIKDGDLNGLGRVVSLKTKGWLPYKLDWIATAVEINKPFKIKIVAKGDLDGRGEWKFSQDGDWVDIHYDWRVDVSKTWMKALSPFLRSLFEANHQWAMKEGEKALVAELERREK